MTITVTDHAILRYLERAGGFEIEQLRESMQANLERAATAAARLGQENYTIRLDGYIFAIVNGVCVTVVKPTKNQRYVVRGDRT